MFWQNLKTIHHACGELLAMDKSKIDDMVANGHAWAVDHIATSSDDIEEVYHFFEILKMVKMKVVKIKVVKMKVVMKMSMVALKI
jgi:hypothetical protein